MRPCLRIRRDLFEQITADLGRPHPFAYERVGFLYGRYSSAADLPLVLATEYVPLADERYIRDRSVGAKINSDAIFEAHDRTKRTGMCCLHAHAHGTGPGATWFSGVDLNTLRRMGPSLRRMAPSAAHGGIVATGTTASALLWVPGQGDGEPATVAIVGFPTLIHRGLNG